MIDNSGAIVVEPEVIKGFRDVHGKVHEIKCNALEVNKHHALRVLVEYHLSPGLDQDDAINFIINNFTRIKEILS